MLKTTRRRFEVARKENTGKELAGAVGKTAFVVGTLWIGFKVLSFFVGLGSLVLPVAIIGGIAWKTWPYIKKQMS